MKGVEIDKYECYECLRITSVVFIMSSEPDIDFFQDQMQKYLMILGGINKTITYDLHEKISV